LDALQRLKEFVERQNIKLFKTSAIPKSLEEHLHALDLYVCKRYNQLPVQFESNSSGTKDSSLIENTAFSSSSSSNNNVTTAASKPILRNIDKTSGFLEAVHEILGGKIIIGRIKYTMQKLRLRDEAIQRKKDLDSLVLSLSTALKAKVLKCPLSLQPVIKVKPPPASAAVGEVVIIKSGLAVQSSSATSVSQSNVFHPSVNEDSCRNDNADVTMSEADFDEAPKCASVAAELSNSHHNEYQAGECGNETLDVGVPIAKSSSSSSSNSSSAVMAETTSKPQKVVVIKYEWYCKFDVLLRSQLLRTDDAIAVWVKVLLSLDHYFATSVRTYMLLL